MFKEMVAERVFGIRSSKTGSSFLSSATQYFDYDKLKFYTFSGMEICEDEELSLLENNTYLFVS